ncbi:Ca2+ transporter [Xylariales sp. AK1849]|nr:Ca2+ transporter [Xylariales sp. AK1849]
MSETRPRYEGAKSYNMMRIKNAAHRESRKNPLQLFGSAKPKRRSTASDLESGRGVSDMPPVQHASTAPNGSPTPVGEESKEADPAGFSEQTQTRTFDSQATTAESPTMNGGNAVRNRKPFSDKSPEPTEDGNKKKGGLFRKRDSGFFKHVEAKEPYTFRNQFMNTIGNSWVNVLLIAVPVGFAVYYAGVNGNIVFAVNFIAIIPLAALLSFGTEELALRTGETLGGLINATFGNAVELIVAVIALIKGEVEVVQTSLIGSILSNLLLVLGMCFYFGGYRRQVQHFNKTVAQTSASLLALAVASNIVPTVFAEHVRSDNTEPASVDQANIAALSRGTSVILLVVYGAYLYFQLETHSKVFAEPSPKSERAPRKKASKEGGIYAVVQAGTAVGAGPSGATQAKDENDHSVIGSMHRHEDMDDDDDDEEKATLSGWVAVATLGVSTVIIAFCAEFMVEGISSITASGVSVEFVGLILLPIVGNAAEHVTAVTVAVKDKMDLAIGVAVGSSMQVSLFLIPLLVIIGWIMGNDDMNLAFDTFQVAVMFVSVLLVNYLIGDGESHWLEGFLLMSLYIIIAVCSWWYPSATNVVG